MGHYGTEGGEFNLSGRVTTKGRPSGDEWPLPTALIASPCSQSRPWRPWSEWPAGGVGLPRSTAYTAWTSPPSAYDARLPRTGQRRACAEPARRPATTKRPPQHRVRGWAAIQQGHPGHSAAIRLRWRATPTDACLLQPSPRSERTTRELPCVRSGRAARLSLTTPVVLPMRRPAPLQSLVALMHRALRLHGRIMTGRVSGGRRACGHTPLGGPHLSGWDRPTAEQDSWS
jgi:hypothetical protein